MADIDTDRCESCGHPLADWCDDECCWWKADAWLNDCAHGYIRLSCMACLAGA